MIICPECKKGQILQSKSKAKHDLKWWEIIVHNGSLICTNNGRGCNYKLDLVHSDRYGTRIAIAKQLSRKPIFLSCSEFMFLLATLAMYAGVSERFAEFLVFKNFYQLKGLKIDFKKLVYEVDDDEEMFIMPFFREATSLISQKFGFMHASDLADIVKSGEIVSTELDKTMRQIMKMVEKISYPRTSGKLKGASYIIHMYY